MKSTLSNAAVGLITSSLLLTSQLTQAVELEADVAVGYDDNPYKLTGSLNPEEGWFLQTGVKLQHEVDDLRFRARLDNRTYEGDVDDANETTVRLDARYRADYKVSGRDARSELRLDYAHRDKTYIARSTGEIGTFGGNSIKNRYDYDNWELRAGTEFELTDQLDMGLELRFRDRDYEDYNIVGLSNLDYQQWKLSNDWEYEVDKDSEVNLELWITRRDFDDKREKDLDGNRIAGTDLEYEYWGLAVGYEREVSRDLEFALKYRYEQRDDSGPGYYDLDEHRITASVDYEPAGDIAYSADLLWRDREYDNDPAAFIDNEETEPSIDGYTLRLAVEKSLAERNDIESKLFAGIRYDDYDSNNPNYKYDRAQVFAGVEVELGD